MSGSNPPHIFMVSYPIQSHAIPLYRLAKYIASKGLFITICTFKHYCKKMREANIIVDDNYDQPTQVGLGSIRFEFLDDDEFEQNDEIFTNFELYTHQLRLIGKQKLPDVLKNQEQKGFPPVSCLIYNPFIPWASDVAESFNIPSVLFVVQCCAVFSVYYHYFHSLVPFPTAEEPHLDVKLPSMPLLKYDEVPTFLHPSTPEEVLKDLCLSPYNTLSKPVCLILDTVQEFDDELIGYMSRFFNIKTIGPLFKVSPFSSSRNRADFVKADSVIEFLDSKPQSSVVYIAFGSIVDVEREQIHEIAHGLLSSKVSFLWVMVMDLPFSNNKEGHPLPEGFLEEVGDRGKIVNWCNQEEVLAHKSVACLLNHCGWNSTVESLTNGVPMLLFPQWGDQVTVAKYLEEFYGTGIRVCRGESERRIVQRHEITKYLLEATDGLKAEEMKRNALKWKKVAEEALAEGGSSTKNLQDLLNVLNLKIKV